VTHRNKAYLYMGNWNHVTGKPGIDLAAFDQEMGEVTFLRTLDRETSCGSLYFNRRRDILYFANETEYPPGQYGGGGRVLGYRIDRKTGELEPLCEALTLCPNPSYVTLDHTEHYMVVSNHSSSDVVTQVERDGDGSYHYRIICDDSTVNLYEMNPDGSIGRLLDVVKHCGAGIRPRQFHPHPHSAVCSPSGRLFAVCDKGNDGIYFYKIDREKNRLVLCPGSPYQDIPGSSPRYCAFHPEKPYFFCNHEGEQVVSVFRYSEEGEVTFLGSENVLGENFPMIPGGRYEQQDLKLHPSGRYLYSLIHGPNVDAVSVLGIDERSGG